MIVMGHHWNLLQLQQRTNFVTFPQCELLVAFPWSIGNAISTSRCRRESNCRRSNATRSLSPKAIMSSQKIIDNVWLLYVCNIHIAVGATLRPIPCSNFFQYINISAISKKDPARSPLYLLICHSTLWIWLFIDSSTGIHAHLGKTNEFRHGHILLREIVSRSQHHILLCSEWLGNNIYESDVQAFIIIIVYLNWWYLVSESGIICLTIARRGNLSLDSTCTIFLKFSDGGVLVTQTCVQSESACS